MRKSGTNLVVELGLSTEVLRHLTHPLANAQVAQTQPIAEWLRTHTRSRHVRIVPNAVRNPLPSVPPTVDPTDVRESARPML